MAAANGERKPGRGRSGVSLTSRKTIMGMPKRAASRAIAADSMSTASVVGPSPCLAKAPAELPCWRTLDETMVQGRAGGGASRRVTSGMSTHAPLRNSATQVAVTQTPTVMPTLRTPANPDETMRLGVSSRSRRSATLFAARTKPTPVRRVSKDRAAAPQEWIPRAQAPSSERVAAQTRIVTLARRASRRSDREPSAGSSVDTGCSEGKSGSGNPCR